MLMHDEKRELVRIARSAIRHALNGTQYGGHQYATETLATPCGAFVTIRCDRELRGCIGNIESDKPLADVVADVAVKAATGDLRFLPLSRTEFASAEIEISVLSRPRPLNKGEEIVTGKHGVVVELGVQRGLLLPQVAVEHHMDATLFLHAAKRKAGIPLEHWDSPRLAVYVFECEVISGQDYPETRVSVS